jgi:membrane-associated phospholipid phosphatase
MTEPATTKPATPAKTAAVPLLITGVVLVVLSLLLGLWLLSRADEPFTIDEWWNITVAGWWNPVLAGICHFMDWVGAGWVGVFAVPIGVGLVLVLVRRPWAAAFFIAAEAVTALVVQVQKHLFGRVRPEDIIVVSDHGSYPSGHVANAAAIAVALFVIFPRVWVAVVGAAWVLLMAFSRTYLHAHWLSDTLGGALAGAGATLLVAAAFAVPMAREAARAVPKQPSLG